MYIGVTPDYKQENSDTQPVPKQETQHDVGSVHGQSPRRSHHAPRWARGKRDVGRRPSRGRGIADQNRSGGGGPPQAVPPAPALSQSPITTTSSRPDKSRGINANHLLRFQSHTVAAQGGRSEGAAGRPRSKKYIQPRPQKFDRNKFLQANYRFVVSDAVNASLHHADADRMFEWEDVLQVELLTSAPLSCPISLDNPPRCPQITPCGHIFSFPAIMAHLLHAGGPQLRRSAPCPLCFAPLISRDLRLVSTTAVVSPKVGQPMVFQLLKRGRTTIVPTIMAEAPQPSLTNIAPAAGTGGAGSALAASPAAGAPAAATAASSPPVVAGSAAGGTAIAAGGAPPKAACKPKKPRDATTPPPPPSPPTPVAGVPTGQLGPLAANCFAKFATVGLSGAGALWEAAARELAAYAAEVVAWGGDDAAVEAPAVYAALDVLALRARRWAEHRAQQLRLGPTGTWVPGHEPPRAATGVPPGSSPEGVAPGLTPEQQGAYAEAQVKKVFMGAVDERALAVALAEEERAREALFPSLPGGPPRLQLPPPSPLPQQQQTGGNAATPGGLNAAAAAFSPQATARGPPDGQGRDQQAGRGMLDPTFMAAFSEEEEEGVEEEEEGDGEEGAEDGSREGGAFAAHALAAKAAAAELQAGSTGEGYGPSAQPCAAGAVGAESSSAAAATSKEDKQMNSATPGGDFYMYQAGDGQWVFMDPLNLKCLLRHYGSYESCPPRINARVLELESVEQTDATRRRWRFLSHLPLSSTFLLAEVALGQREGGPLPGQALTPFAEELGAREKRRRRRAAAERKAAADRVAAERSARSARQGPSSEELAAMPTLTAAGPAGEARSPPLFGGGGVFSAGQQLLQQQGSLAREEAAAAARALGFASAEDLAASVALQASLDEKRDGAQQLCPGTSPTAAPGAGPPSFAQLARMGFAATGPALGSSPPSTGTALQAQAAGAWASKSSALRGATTAAAAATPTSSSRSAPTAAPPLGLHTPRGLGAAAFPPPSGQHSLGGGWPSAGPIASAAAAGAAAQPQPTQGPAPAGMWGAGPSFRATVASQPAPTPPAAGPGKRGAKKGQVLLTTTTQRKY